MNKIHKINKEIQEIKFHIKDLQFQKKYGIDTDEEIKFYENKLLNLEVDLAVIKNELRRK